MRSQRSMDQRKRLIIDFSPNQMGKEERIMKAHKETVKQWSETANFLANKTGRDQSLLVMNSDDLFRRISEQKFLISQVVHHLATKDTGTWTPNPCIGDLYAQAEKTNLSKFESIGVTGISDTTKRPCSWFDSKYFKKRIKQLRSYIEKIKPFEPDFSGLEIIGKPLNLNSFSVIREVPDEPEVVIEENLDDVEEAKSLVKINLSSNRLFFRSIPGVTQAKCVEVTNEGTTAIYYKWELAHDIDLMVGEGSERVPLRRPPSPSAEDANEAFDWRSSESFIVPKDMLPKCRSEFIFTQTAGSILPGNSTTFSFAFKSDVPGCFTQRWVLRVTPKAESDTPLTVSLRGCAEVSPPDLTVFKQSINESLHESERTRCIEEILATVFDRVSQLSVKSRGLTEDRIDGDVLIDDRAPVFEEANKKWGMTYSPGLYASLMQIADETWDEIGVTGFNRYWDSKITSLSTLIMQVKDGERKRELLKKLNEIVRLNMTANQPVNLSFSIAFVQLSSLMESVPDIIASVSSINGLEVQPFVAPKAADNQDDEDNADAMRKKHKGKGGRDQRKPKPKAKKGKEEQDGRGLQSGDSQRGNSAADVQPEIKAQMVAQVKDLLKKKINIFEMLAGENRGVSAQLTRINEVERLDTNLDAEVDDDM